MFKWFEQRGKPAPASKARADQELSRLERHIERLEQTIQSLAKETRKQNIVVRQLHIHHPVVENVTFRLDALDIKDLSGSLNLGNNFDVQFDPKTLFRSKGDGERKTQESSGQTSRPGVASQPHDTADRSASSDDIRRTSSGYSYSAPKAASTTNQQAPNPDSLSKRKL